MKIEKFNESLSAQERVFKFNGKPLRQMIIDSYNKQGYKLYYYYGFQLIEIESIRGKIDRTNWKKDWGTIVFFLNESEYNAALKLINKSKELYDLYLKNAKHAAELPLSHIYYSILKLGK